MKKILITGANSYIGTSFERYVKEHYPNEFEVDTVDMVDGSWREKDFSGYDSVFHVAGIAHIKETKDNPQLYYKINRDLAVETATKAKAEGVKQFVFLSSMSVYGKDKGIITVDTVPDPKSNYGKSKYQAEIELQKICGDGFLLAVLRPPMVYGRECKGNYNSLRSFALKLPFFPYVKNQRSMLYIENLCEFVRLIIVNEESGAFFPQNSEYTNTSEMVKMIAAAHGKKLHLIHGFGWLVKFFGLFVKKIRKAFGSLTYNSQMNCDIETQLPIGVQESIRLTESIE